MNFRRVSEAIAVTFISATAPSLARADVAAPLDDDAKRKLIETIAKPLEAEKVFYRWQSGDSGAKLLAAGGMTDTVHRYFMTMATGDGAHFAAGKGVYMSENVHSSSEYAGRDGTGSLIEVRLDKGTPTLDLTDSSVISRMKDLGLTKQDVYRLDPEVAVKYNGGQQWWVAKGKQGVRFIPFDGRGHELPTLVEGLRTMNPSAQQTFIGLLEPTLMRALAENPKLRSDPAFYRLLSEKQQISTLRDFITSARTPDAEFELHAFARSEYGQNTIKRLRLGPDVNLAETRYASVKELISRYHAGRQEYLAQLLKNKLSVGIAPETALTNLNELKEGGPFLKAPLRIALGPSLRELTERPDLNRKQTSAAKALASELGLDADTLRFYVENTLDAKTADPAKFTKLQDLVAATGDPRAKEFVESRFAAHLQTTALTDRIMSGSGDDAASLIARHGAQMEPDHLLETIIDAPLAPAERFALIHQFSDRLRKPPLPRRIVKYLTTKPFPPGMNAEVVEAAIEFGTAEDLTDVVEYLGGMRAPRVKDAIFGRLGALREKEHSFADTKVLSRLFEGPAAARALASALDKPDVPIAEKLAMIKWVSHANAAEPGTSKEISKLIAPRASSLIAAETSYETTRTLADSIQPAEREEFVSALIRSGLDARDKGEALLSFLTNSKDPVVPDPTARAWIRSFIQNAKPDAAVLKLLEQNGGKFTRALLEAEGKISPPCRGFVQTLRAWIGR